MGDIKAKLDFISKLSSEGEDLLLIKEIYSYANDPQVRLAVVKRLTEESNAKSMDILLSSLYDPAEEVASYALMKIVNSNNVNHIPVLQELKKNAPANMEEAVAIAIKHLEYGATMEAEGDDL